MKITYHTQFTPMNSEIKSLLSTRRKIVNTNKLPSIKATIYMIPRDVSNDNRVINYNTPTPSIDW